MPRLAVLLLALLAFGCSTPVPAPLVDPMGNGAARERWLFEQRAYPSGTIPADARRQALDEARRRERVRTDAETPVRRWRSLGPLPVRTAWPWKTATGRMKTLAVSPRDPNIILAGSSSGGIWRSTDGGNSFVPVSDAHSDLSVGVVGFAPSDPDVAYAVSGSDFLGTGVLRSTDAGATWQVVDGPSFAPRGTADRMVIDPFDANRLWVAQTSLQDASTGQRFASGLLRSDDGGFAWSTLFRGITTDFAASPGGAPAFLLGIARNDQGGNAGLHRSVDGGRTWTTVFPGKGAFPSFVFSFSPASPSRVYLHAYMSGEGRMHVSDDGGVTWSGLAPLPPTGNPSFLTAHPTIRDQLYLGFPGGDLYVSADGGLSWRNVTKSRNAEGQFDPAGSLTHIDQHALVFSPADARVLLLANDGGIYRSADGGATFTSLAGTLPVVQAYGIAAHPLDPVMLFLGTQDNGLERRAAGEWRELITGDYGSILFDSSNPASLITNYVFGTIFAFTENGNRYAATRATPETFGESAPYRIGFIAPFEHHRRTNALYFGTWRLFVSRDFGVTWSAPAGELDLTRGRSDTISAIGLAPAAPGVIYTGSATGRVMLSRDDGSTWTDVTSALPERYVRAIAVDPLDPAVAWVAFSGYRSDHVYRTGNSGATWQPVSAGLPDVPVNALLIDPASRHVMYAGTDIGVFVLDGGGPWQLLGDGMPPVVVTDFDVTAGGRIVAATYGRGAYELVTEVRRRRGVRH